MTALSPDVLGDVRTRDGGSPPAGILHLGLGSFHRAHQAVYTDTALDVAGGDWGIVGVSSRSSHIVDAMRAQSLLYTVVEISPEGSAFRVPRAHSDVFVGALLTGVMFKVGQYLLGLYFRFGSSTSAYGAAGSFVAVLLWVYYSSWILFFGAEFTKVWVKAHGRRIVPDAVSSHALPTWNT